MTVAFTSVPSIPDAHQPLQQLPQVGRCAGRHLRHSCLLVLTHNRGPDEASCRLLLYVLIASAQLRLPLAAARLEGALDLLRVGQRRPERRTIIGVADALQPRKVAALSAWL